MITETNTIAATNEPLPIQPTTPRRLRPYPTCKIARLPLELREMVNQSLANNLSYPEIISRLDAAGHPGINPKNISRWAYSGYLVWLQKYESKDFLRQQIDASSDLMHDLDASDPTACSRENHIYISTQLGQLMRGLNLKPLRRKLESDPAQFFRLVRSVNAQTRNTIRQQKLQQDAANKQANQLANDQRDLGQLPSTTSAEGYAAAAAYYGLPPRFAKGLPNSESKTQNQQTN